MEGWNELWATPGEPEPWTGALDQLTMSHDMDNLLGSPGCDHTFWWAKRDMPSPLPGHVWVAEGQGSQS